MTTNQYNNCVHQWADALYSCAYHWTKDKVTAQDIVQETFLKLWKKKDDVLIETAKSYVFTIARNLSIDHHRAHVRTMPLEHASHGHTDRQGEHERTEFLMRLLDSIDELPRKMIIMYDLEGYKYREIADHLDLSLSNVKVMIYRGRKQLKALAKRYYEHQY